MFQCCNIFLFVVVSLLFLVLVVCSDVIFLDDLWIWIFFVWVGMVVIVVQGECLFIGVVVVWVQSDFGFCVFGKILVCLVDIG